MKKNILFLISILLFTQSNARDQQKYTPKSYSGVYPNLAMYNNEGECGTGAVVEWANNIWVITYGPHKPFGSTDKLYQISPDLKQTVRPESIGGSPANRMIHKESNQLFIGPYAIDSTANVRTISWKDMPGRLTGSARHLTEPADKLFFGTMEEGIYEVDVQTLKPTVLYKDGNINLTPYFVKTEANLPGVHGKGLYSGQGVLVYSNNGEGSKLAERKFDIDAGVLAEWNGKEWSVIRRNQFTEVTGPGGINGNTNSDTDPIWATGWDFKSVLIGVRDNGKWSFYRLPKASHSYDGAHGWNTEWPRIRDIGTPDNPDYLMTMHGMFWKFPATFCSTNSFGIRPRSAYLKVIGDFTRWNNQLVFGCDDTAKDEFLNKRKIKGDCESPGQSNSNLWFTSLNQPDLLGPNTAEGAVWISEKINSNDISEPFLFSGWDYRSAWIKNQGSETVCFTFEVDKIGNNDWMELRTVEVEQGKSLYIPFTEKGEWIRVKADKNTIATVQFSYAQHDGRKAKPANIFKELAKTSDQSSKAGLLWDLGKNRRVLGVLSGTVNNKDFTENGYYELDSLMQLVKKNDEGMQTLMRQNLAIPKHEIIVEESSVLIIDELNRRWRLPLGDERFTNLTKNSLMRMCREVVTERDLLNCSGTFYELPAENADGFAKIRPIASHNYRIYDFASYRGLLVMTGVQNEFMKSSSHIITSSDGKASVWVGVIDDLWKLGKPVGHGGPWKNSVVKKNIASDPYLIGFYDKRTLQLFHNSNEDVIFNIEVEPIGHGPWMIYKQVKIKAGETFKYTFPDSFQSRWIRFVANKDCQATAMLIYK